MTALVKTKADLEALGVSQVDYILLDGSSSMYSRIATSLQSIDGYAAELKANAVNSTIFVATFAEIHGGVAYEEYPAVTPNSWESCMSLQIPGGSTPLYDAINAMCRRMRELRPEKASIVIVTDGEENGSKTSAPQARALLDWCRAQGWQVTFIGCDFNNLNSARLLGANDSNAIGVNARRLSDVTKELGKKRSYYDKHGTPMSFSDDEKQQFGGYLSYSA